MTLTPEEKERLNKSIAFVMQEMKYAWTAECPDGRVLKWHTWTLDGDIDLISDVLTLMDFKMLKLGYYKVLPPDPKNPYSVKLALLMLYQNKGEIKFSGNVPDFDKMPDSLPPDAIE